MARSHGVIKVAVWQPDSEFRKLSRDAQRAYLLLISQPQINNCGVLPYTPERWSRMAADDSLRAFKRAVRELSVHGFVVVDDRTRELLVRTYVKHDNIESQPNLVKAAQREFRETESAQIRTLLLAMNAQIFLETAQTSDMELEPLPEGVVEGVPEDLREPLAELLRVRVRATRAAPAPKELPQSANTATGLSDLDHPPGNGSLPQGNEEVRQAALASLGIEPTDDDDIPF